MKKTFTAIAFVLLFVSCGSKHRRQMIKDLTNNDFKYWYRYHKDTSKPYSLGFCFYTNGTFVRYENPKGDHAKRQMYTHPVLSESVWKFIDDSTMLFGEGVIFRIITLTADSIILGGADPLDSNYLKLHRDKDQITKPS